MAKNVIGAGLGFRPRYEEEIHSQDHRVRWFEVLCDNHFNDGGLPLRQIERLAERYPITLHSVGLSIGSTDPLDFEYLGRIKKMHQRFKPAWFSDHLCWTSVHGKHYHELLPLPYTAETVKHVADRISQVQDFIGEQILIENVSSYLSYQHSELSEAEFVRGIVETADCGLLLDVNNIYVSAFNHGFSTAEYLQTIPAERVREIHLGGFDDRETYLHDSHNAPVAEGVWDLYRDAIGILGSVPTMIEWDSDFPGFEVILKDVHRAQSVLDDRCLNEALSPGGAVILTAS